MIEQLSDDKTVDVAFLCEAQTLKNKKRTQKKQKTKLLLEVITAQRPAVRL